jgi:hypothetical protein
MADVLPFCGRFIPYPIGGSETHAIQEDARIQSYVERVMNLVQSDGASVLNTSACTDAIAREYCLTTFEVRVALRPQVSFHRFPFLVARGVRRG